MSTFDGELDNDASLDLAMAEMREDEIEIEVEIPQTPQTIKKAYIITDIDAKEYIAKEFIGENALREAYKFIGDADYWLVSDGDFKGDNSSYYCGAFPIGIYDIDEVILR